jgi:hypothetical protein
MKEDKDSDGKIWRGIDANGNVIRTTEEEEEQAAAKLQKWQRDKFARELGFSPDTTDKEELAAINKKYEQMLEKVNEWNENTQKRIDEIKLADIKFSQGLITYEECENIHHPHKGWKIKLPEDWGGHGPYFNIFYCTKCKNEFCMFNEKGEQVGTYRSFHDYEDDVKAGKTTMEEVLKKEEQDESKKIGTEILCWICIEVEKERKTVSDYITKTTLKLH